MEPSHCRIQQAHFNFDSGTHLECVQFGWANFFVACDKLKEEWLSESSGGFRKVAFAKFMSKVRVCHRQHTLDAEFFQAVLRQLQRTQMELDQCVQEVNTLKQINQRLRAKVDEMDA